MIMKQRITCSNTSILNPDVFPPFFYVHLIFFYISYTNVLCSRDFSSFSFLVLTPSRGKEESATSLTETRLNRPARLRKACCLQMPESFNHLQKVQIRLLDQEKILGQRALRCRGTGVCGVAGVATGAAAGAAACAGRGARAAACASLTSSV